MRLLSIEFFAIWQFKSAFEIAFDKRWLCQQQCILFPNVVNLDLYLVILLLLLLLIIIIVVVVVIIFVVIVIIKFIDTIA